MTRISGKSADESSMPLLGLGPSATGDGDSKPTTSSGGPTPRKGRREKDKSIVVIVEDASHGEEFL